MKKNKNLIADSVIDLLFSLSKKHKDSPENIASYMMYLLTSIYADLEGKAEALRLLKHLIKEVKK